MRALRRNGASTTPYRARGLSTCQQREWERHLGEGASQRARLHVGAKGRWWRWGRIELPVQNRVAGDFLQVFPAYFGFRVADPRPAGCSACYPVMPLGSLTPLTGVGDAAPPLMTSSPSGEGGRRRCSLTKQRRRNCCCQLLALPAVLRGLRATSTCDLRSLSPVET